MRMRTRARPCACPWEFKRSPNWGRGPACGLPKNFSAWIVFWRRCASAVSPWSWSPTPWKLPRLDPRLLSAAAIDDHVVAVGSVSGEGDAAAAEILQCVGVLGGQNVVGEKDAAAVHHARDVGHGQRLLKTIVIDK